MEREILPRLPGSAFSNTYLYPCQSMLGIVDVGECCCQGSEVLAVVCVRDTVTAV